MLRLDERPDLDGLVARDIQESPSGTIPDKRRARAATEAADPALRDRVILFVLNPAPIVICKSVARELIPGSFRTNDVPAISGMATSQPGIS
jgi:hypothetical protein